MSFSCRTLVLTCDCHCCVPLYSVLLLTAKSSFVWEQVPLLETEGVVIAQSRAIERFLAKRFGFFGKNDVEAALIDSVSEELADAR